MTRGLAVRLGVAVLAVVVCVWFGLLIHQNHDQTAAMAVLTSGHAPTAAQVRHSDALLSSASWLNPDRGTTVDRAKLALDSGHPARARAILAPLLAAEPDNLAGWIGMVLASTRDLNERKLAYLHVLALTDALG